MPKKPDPRMEAALEELDKFVTKHVIGRAAIRRWLALDTKRRATANNINKLRSELAKLEGH